MANKIIITGAAIAKKNSDPGVEMVIHYNNSKKEAVILQKKLLIFNQKFFLDL
tara:strand:+ start:69 stop:227 length:159 start_codon:yes stop_codon:yes gene_type:complete